jgi:hypothetical protein
VANSANPATSKSSIMAAKTLQNHTKAAAAASAASSGIFLLWHKLIWQKNEIFFFHFAYPSPLDF